MQLGLPAKFMYCPLSHSVQFDLPVFAWYLFAGHGLHFLPAILVPLFAIHWPGMHNGCFRHSNCPGFA